MERLEADRLVLQEAYVKKRQKIEYELAHQRQKIKYQAEGEERGKTLAQQRADRDALEDAAAEAATTSNSIPGFVDATGRAGYDSGSRSQRQSRLSAGCQRRMGMPKTA